MMKKVIVGVLVVIIILGVYFGLSSPKANNTTIVTSMYLEGELEIEEDLGLVEELLEEKEENLSVDDIDKALELDKELDIPKEVEPEMFANVIDIMTQTHLSDVEKVFPSKKGITPRVAIEIPKNTVKKLSVGDTISLPNMGNGQFNAKITAKTTHNNGSVSVSGNLVDSGSQYSVVLTEGKSMTFGTVTTPNGSYEIEAKNGQGYVYSTSDIDKGWIDYGKSDTLTTDGHDD